MSSEIFIEDFERTKNSYFLHGVIGRSLIVATRFDAMCTALSMAIEIKSGAVDFLFSNEGFDKLLHKLKKNTELSILGFNLSNFLIKYPRYCIKPGKQETKWLIH